jgi:hypothetical protein
VPDTSNYFVVFSFHEAKDEIEALIYTMFAFHREFQRRAA